MEALFLLGLAVAFVFAHYSDKPPLEERPIRIERADHPRIADDLRLGVMVQDTGLRVGGNFPPSSFRGGASISDLSEIDILDDQVGYSRLERAEPGIQNHLRKLPLDSGSRVRARVRNDVCSNRATASGNTRRRSCR